MLRIISQELTTVKTEKPAAISFPQGEVT